MKRRFNSKTKALSKSLGNRAQAITELVFFLPVFLILFVVHFWFQWAMNGSIVHQQHVRGQTFYLIRNSALVESRHLRASDNFGAESIRNNNFYVGFSDEPQGQGTQTISPKYWAFFSGDGFSNPGKIKIRTVFGICMGSLWNDKEAKVWSESSVADLGSQDPHDLCR
jgi:hypothetical protein